MSPGLWFNGDIETGPFGTGPAPTGTETTSVSVTSLAFDPAVTSTVGDSVENAHDRCVELRPRRGRPRLVGHDPDRRSTRPRRCTTVVSGTLFVNGISAPDFLAGSLQPEQFFTNELAAIPYRYRVTP